MDVIRLYRISAGLDIAKIFMQCMWNSSANSSDSWNWPRSSISIMFGDILFGFNRWVLAFMNNQKNARLMAEWFRRSF